jgi:hypothetical protein
VFFINHISLKIIFLIFKQACFLIILVYKITNKTKLKNIFIITIYLGDYNVKCKRLTYSQIKITKWIDEMTIHFDQN